MNKAHYNLLIFLSLCYSSSIFAKWDLLVKGPQKVWKSTHYTKTYLTQLKVGHFSGNPTTKKNLLEIFNIYDWEINKNTTGYILGEYIDHKGKLNYFFESKLPPLVHMTTTNKDVDLLNAFKSFKKSQE